MQRHWADRARLKTSDYEQHHDFSLEEMAMAAGVLSTTVAPRHNDNHRHLIGWHRLNDEHHGSKEAQQRPRSELLLDI